MHGSIFTLHVAPEIIGNAVDRSTLVNRGQRIFTSVSRIAGASVALSDIDAPAVHAGITRAECINGHVGRWLTTFRTDSIAHHAERTTAHHVGAWQSWILHADG